MKLPLEQQDKKQYNEIPAGGSGARRSQAPQYSLHDTSRFAVPGKIPRDGHGERTKDDLQKVPFAVSRCHAAYKRALSGSSAA